MAELVRGYSRKVALITLASEVFHGALFPSGSGKNEIPAHRNLPGDFHIAQHPDHIRCECLSFNRAMTSGQAAFGPIDVAVVIGVVNLGLVVRGDQAGGLMHDEVLQCQDAQMAI